MEEQTRTGRVSSKKSKKLVWIYKVASFSEILIVASWYLRKQKTRTSRNLSKNVTKMGVLPFCALQWNNCRPTDCKFIEKGIIVLIGIIALLGISRNLLENFLIEHPQAIASLFHVLFYLKIRVKLMQIWIFQTCARETCEMIVYKHSEIVD